MKILSVNVGASRPITIKNNTLQTGIYKIPTTDPVPVSRLGLEGDVQIEPRKMGAENNAVYAYPYEHYDYWQHELGREPFPIGQFGENLTVTGLLEEEVRIGDIFRFGNTVLQVAHPRIPCRKLNERMGLRFAPMFMASRKVGYYLRVLEEGTIEKGDSIELLERDENSPTMEEFLRVTQYEYWNVEALQHLLQARDLMPAWQEMIEAKLERAQTSNGWHGLRELEVIHHKQESENFFSIELKCIRGKTLAPFHGTQQLMVNLGDRVTRLQRQAYHLSGNPQDLSTYRIAVNNKANAYGNNSIVSNHLAKMKVGDHILCSAPHGVVSHVPEEIRGVQVIPVLVSQGIGIALMLSMLYELEGQHSHIAIAHESTVQDPKGLLDEANILSERNLDFHLIHNDSSSVKNVTAKLISEHVPLIQADIHIAGSADFIERLSIEFMALDYSPAALKTHTFE